MIVRIVGFGLNHVLGIGMGSEQEAMERVWRGEMRTIYIEDAVARARWSLELLRAGLPYSAGCSLGNAILHATGRQP